MRLVDRLLEVVWRGRTSVRSEVSPNLSPSTDVATLKEKGDTHRLLQIVDEQEPFAPRRLEAIKALGELRCQEALDVLRRLFSEVQGNDVPWAMKDSLLQPVVAAVANIQGPDSADRHLRAFRQEHGSAGDVGKYALAIGVLGQLKDARAFDGMIWKLGAISELDLSRGEAEYVLLLARALGAYADTRAVAPLILASHIAEAAIARASVDLYVAIDQALAATLKAVLRESFGIRDEERSARIPGALHALMVEHGIDKAEAVLADARDNESREKKRREFEIRDETEESLTATYAVYRSGTAQGWVLWTWRVEQYVWAARRRLGAWAAEGRPRRA
jgi:hypothetical protein